MRTRCSRALALLFFCACDGADAPIDAGRDADSTPDAARVDGGPIPDLAIVTPADGSSFLESVALVAGGVSIEGEIEFYVGDESSPRCSALPLAPCLVDLSDIAEGSETRVRAVASAGGLELEDEIAIERAAIERCASEDHAGCVTAWIADGSGAGYEGLTYQNRDGDHALLDVSPFPGLELTRSAPDQGVTGLMADPILGDEARIVIANASLAYLPPGGSMSVARYGVPLLPNVWSSMYQRNKIFWCPEHRDVGIVDFSWFHAAFAPISAGSSYSELDEISAMFYALGALRPDARARMRESGTVLSSIAMISRRGRVASDTEYLSAMAHPSSFHDPSGVRAMVELAHSITPDTAPPAARIEVTEDDPHFDTMLWTAESVARVWTDPSREPRRIVASAAPSLDPNDRALTYHWRVLRGASATITPIEADGSVVEIVFASHGDESVADGGQTRTSALAVVALFVHNGVYFSPPAFVTSYGHATLPGPAPDENNLD